MRQLAIFRWGNWGTEKLHSIPKVTLNLDVHVSNRTLYTHAFTTIYYAATYASNQAPEMPWNQAIFKKLRTLVDNLWVAWNRSSYCFLKTKHQTPYFNKFKNLGIKQRYPKDFSGYLIRLVYTINLNEYNIIWSINQNTAQSNFQT